MKFPVRLDKFISQATALSRKQAKASIKSGQVCVNESVITASEQKILQDDKVVYRNQVLNYQPFRYFMLNKPIGYVCATKDRRHLTVLDLIDEPRKEQLSVAGRLDIDTTGLVLLTDNGQWLHDIISPKKLCPKSYRIETESIISTKDHKKLTEGIWLTKEQVRTAPADLKKIHDYEYLLTITEGRYHQVKRMISSVDNKVVTLHRESIGRIYLDDHLQPGEYRSLTEEEVTQIK